MIVNEQLTKINKQRGEDGSGEGIVIRKWQDMSTHSQQAPKV